VSPSAGLRLDRWLFAARLVRRRTQAAALVAAKRIRRNGALVDKPHQRVRPGDVLTIVLPRHLVLCRVRAVAERRGPPEQAQHLYELLEGSDAWPP